jgi:riboflavin kinase, archaea type
VKALPQVAFEGAVFSGKGEGKKFVDLPWVKRQIEAKLDFTPFSGTLNIRLTKESEEKKILLEKSKGKIIEPQLGYCPGELFKAHIGVLECAVIVPKISNYPNDVLEVIAPVCLREKFKLADGSLVAVAVNV